MGRARPHFGGLLGPLPYTDQISNDIETKVNQLQDVSQIDAEMKLNLWKQTFSYRREYIRNQSTSYIVKKFPGYSHPFLVSRVIIKYHIEF
jgi:hypothetical protein